MVRQIRSLLIQVPGRKVEVKVEVEVERRGEGEERLGKIRLIA